MPNSYARDGIVNPNPTTIKDSYSNYITEACTLRLAHLGFEFIVKISSKHTNLYLAMEAGLWYCCGVGVGGGGWWGTEVSYLNDEINTDSWHNEPQTTKGKGHFMVLVAYLKQTNVSYENSLVFEPSHEIMALFVLRKFILQTRMRSHPVGLEVWFLVGPFVYFHTSCVRIAKALARLRGCAGSPEPSLVAYVRGNNLCHGRNIGTIWPSTMFELQGKFFRS